MIEEKKIPFIFKYLYTNEIYTNYTVITYKIKFKDNNSLRNSFYLHHSSNGWMIKLVNQAHLFL